MILLLLYILHEFRNFSRFSNVYKNVNIFHLNYLFNNFFFDIWRKVLFLLSDFEGTSHSRMKIDTQQLQIYSYGVIFLFHGLMHTLKRVKITKCFLLFVRLIFFSDIKAAIGRCNLKGWQRPLHLLS